jgi:hypothetical protein
MAVERPGVRPAVLSGDTVEALAEFRHLWRLLVDAWTGPPGRAT